MIDKNLFTHKILEKKKKAILDNFPELKVCKHDNFYSLSEYIYESPSKFYDKKIYRELNFFLENLIDDPNNFLAFLKILNDLAFEFNHAVKTMNELNLKDIHENLLPDNDAELMYFFSEKIVYEYLKITDVVLLGFLKPIAYYLRIKNNKGIDNLDIYNCIDTLKKHNIFNDLTNKYNNTIRNAIAHGGVTFESSTIKFKDKKDTKSFYASRFIKEFDDLINCTNALILAYKKILFQYLDVLLNHNIAIPASIMEIELRHKANHQDWNIIHSYDSEIPKGKQYNVLVETNLNSRKFMNFSAVYTAITLENLLPKKYDNFFIQIKTKYQLSCWQVIDLEKLREHFTGKKVIITDGTYFFEEKYLAEKKDSIKIYKTVLFHKNIDRNKVIDVRYIKHHSKKYYNVIENAGVFLNITDDQIENFIRNKTREIVSLVKSEKRKKYSNNFKEYFFPDKYLQIHIYQGDLRKRSFHYGRQNKNLIATLHINETKRIKNIVPAWGIKEENKNCLIVWNK
ncbi:hypothetical protein [Chryseobacterium sp. c4a]|uniref:hypothetical protein n=1 Tax=Chryseobacterium sp. c4a TaxID=1573582 RepID=UPI00135A19E0|nr:hypothetical protein [Chryseobacterium sp. c4a]